MNPIKNKNIRFDSLTGLRCIAACMVFAYHNRKYWRADLPDFFIKILNEFYLGVSVFFVLSGFLIAYNYGEKPARSAKAYLKYISIRIARIIPLYWLILTAFYLDKKYGGKPFSLLTYSLFHGFSNVHNLDAIAQAWSLTVEMTFYFLAPLLFLLLIKSIKRALLILCLIFVLFYGTGYLLHYYTNATASFLYPIEFLFNGTFAGQSLVFFFGMLLALSAKENKNIISKYFNAITQKTLIGFIGMVVVFIILCCIQKDIYDQSNKHISGIIIQITLLPFFVSIFMGGLMTEKTWIQQILSTRLFILLGNASFAFYLIHISYVNIKLKSFVLLPDRNFIILWLLSIILYLFFENPIYNWVRKKLKRDTN
jgi:peptidoglycan/LPS O-acetylase OafA/YrhL